jgi:hypothetical protein
MMSAVVASVETHSSMSASEKQENSPAPASVDKPRNDARNARLNWSRKTDREVSGLLNCSLSLLFKNVTGNQREARRASSRELQKFLSHLRRVRHRQWDPRRLSV